MSFKLSSLYNNPRLSGSLGGVARFVKERGFNDFEKTKAYLETLKEYQLFRPSRKKFLRRKFLYLFLDHTWCSDILDLQKYVKENNGWKYVLIVLDGFSRKLKAYFLEAGNLKTI